MPEMHPKEFLQRLERVEESVSQHADQIIIYAAHDDIEDALKESQRVQDMLKRLEKFQRDAEKLMPALRDLIEDEIHAEEELIAALKLFFNKHESREAERVLAHLKAAIAALQKKYRLEAEHVAKA